MSGGFLSGGLLSCHLTYHRGHSLDGSYSLPQFEGADVTLISCIRQINKIN